MTQMRISEAAELLGCSSDTVRRLVDSGRLPAGVDEAGKKVVALETVGDMRAQYLASAANEVHLDATWPWSLRNWPTRPIRVGRIRARRATGCAAS